MAHLTSLSLVVATCISCGGDSNGGGGTLGCSLSGSGNNSKGTKVFNGEQCRGGDSSIALLVLKDASGSEVAMCSGTLIAPTAVLTAAHCVEEKGDLAVRSVDVHIGGSIINTTQFKQHPKYDGESGSPYDVAVLKLPLPANGTPLPIRGSRSPSKGELVRVFGYGTDESQESLYDQGTYQAGPKQTDLKVVVSEEGTIVAGAEGTGLCAGDSGGPMLAGDRSQVLGVNSAGIGDKCGSSILSREELLALLNLPPEQDLNELLPLSTDGGKHFAVNILVDISAAETLTFIAQEADGVVVE